MNLLGIDFEDWFHPELVQHNVKTKDRTFKVVNGLDKILDFLNRHDTYATFFMVGEILESFPEILDKILSNRHEIAFHSMSHLRLDCIDSQQFANELEVFSKLSKKKSKGFRAPTFSLNEKSSWAIDVLEKFHYLYDSSIVPAKTSMYGNPNAPINPYKISSNSLNQDDPEGKIIEFPLMVTKFFGRVIPIGGGFYLRTLPLSVTKKALQEYEKKNLPGVFYIHSWELTPEDMPRIKMSKKASFITYHNLEKAASRMGKLLSNFQFTSFEKFNQKNF